MMTSKPTQSNTSIDSTPTEVIDVTTSNYNERIYFTFTFSKMCSCGQKKLLVTSNNDIFAAEKPWEAMWEKYISQLKEKHSNKMCMGVKTCNLDLTTFSFVLNNPSIKELYWSKVIHEKEKFKRTRVEASTQAQETRKGQKVEDLEASGWTKELPDFKDCTSKSRRKAILMENLLFLCKGSVKKGTSIVVAMLEDMIKEGGSFDAAGLLPMIKTKQCTLCTEMIRNAPCAISFLTKQLTESKRSLLTVFLALTVVGHIKPKACLELLGLNGRRQKYINRARDDRKLFDVHAVVEGLILMGHDVQCQADYGVLKQKHPYGAVGIELLPWGNIELFESEGSGVKGARM